MRPSPSLHFINAINKMDDLDKETEKPSKSLRSTRDRIAYFIQDKAHSLGIKGATVAVASGSTLLLTIPVTRADRKNLQYVLFMIMLIGLAAAGIGFVVAIVASLCISEVLDDDTNKLVTPTSYIDYVKYGDKFNEALDTIRTKCKADDPYFTDLSDDDTGFISDPSDF
jgi:hypothetical protein